MRLKYFVIAVLSSVALMIITSCSKPEPVRIGFMAGLSGRVADLGGSGRNGALLAVEQRNAAGGINGHPVELVVRDDEQNPETARLVIGELIGQGIELIIGPMTSSIAMAVVPQVNSSKSILLSPTVTTTDLSGKDDNFLRAISTTTEYASKSARYQYKKLGSRRVAAIYDLGNRSYTESWLNDFKRAYTELGGKIVLVKSFRSGSDTVFNPLVRELVSSGADTVLIIGNSVDSALICQQLRMLDPGKRVVMAEWASTERLIELTGPAAEGVVISQFLNRNDTSPRYRDFLAAYRARFGQEPGFAGVAGYDAALIALEAYSLRKQGESLKKVIIDKSKYQGVQQQLTIDRFGDADRRTFVTTVRDNKFVTVE